MTKEITYEKTSSKSYDDTITSLEKNVADNMFRVLHTHNVKATLAEKEFEINPLKIMEVCNSNIRLCLIEASSTLLPLFI